MITSQVRLLAHNALALFVTWITLNTVLTFALFLTFGMDHLLTTRSASLVELCIAGFLVFFYVLVDLTVCDKYSRSVHGYKPLKTLSKFGIDTEVGLARSATEPSTVCMCGRK